MAFLGSIGKTFEHIVKNPVVQVLFPAAAVGSLLGYKGISTALHKLSAFENAPAVDTHDHQLLSYQPVQPYPVGYPYSGGPSPWDYSMQSPGFSTLPVATPVQDYYLQQVPSSRTYPDLGWFP